MFNRILIVFTLLFGLIHKVKANVEDPVIKEFRSLRSGPNIPAFFTDFLSVSSDGKHLNKESEEQYKIAIYGIYKRFASGAVLFDEACSKYVNKVADYILRDKPALRKELQFFVLKDEAVNAFCTAPGIIFVTTGLLAKVESEAQLAFILAHEVYHHVGDHILDQFDVRRKLEHEDGPYKSINQDDKLMLLSSYNKDQEFEADEYAIQLMKNTSYDLEEINGAFYMLLYAYLPFKDKKFSLEMLNTGALQIPEKYVNQEANDVLMVVDYDDELHSHPNLDKRIANAEKLKIKNGVEGGEKFIVSQSTFKKVQTLSRFECINELLTNQHYDKALYNVLIMEEEFPDLDFIIMSKVKALYGLVMYKNRQRLSEVAREFKKVEGEISVLNYMLSELNSAQLNVIAFRHAFDVNQKLKTSTSQLYEDKLMEELALYSGLAIDSIQSFSFPRYRSILSEGIGFDVNDSIEKIDALEMSKYEKIQLKKSVSRFKLDTISVENYDENFHYFALADIVLKNELKEKLFNLDDNHVEQVVHYHHNSKVKDGQNRQIIFVNPDRYKDISLNNVVFVDPLVALYDRKGLLQPYESLKYRDQVMKAYMKNYQRIDLEKRMLDIWKVNENKDFYNDMHVVQNWFKEVLNHEGIEMIASSHDQMQSVSEKLGTSHFVFSLVMSDRSIKRSVIYTVSVDSKTDQPEYFNFYKSKSRLKKSRLRLQVFSTLKEISN